MKNVRMNIPSRFLRIAPQKKTVATRNKKTGTFTGRKVVQGKYDSTRSQYLIHDVDLNEDGRIGKNEHGGLILGRKNIRVKSTARARGYERRV
jgi:hypothetical protein